MQSSASMESAAFTCFPRLPKELRRAIWRFCLPPDRVEEMDNVSYQFAFYLDDKPCDTLGPCSLYMSSRLNRYPPIISRVCFEAREMALEGFRPITNAEVAVPENCQLDSSNAATGKPWWNRTGTLLNLYWNPDYDYDGGGGEGHEDNRSYEKPLRCLEWRLSQRRGHQVGSFVAAYLNSDYGDDVPDVSTPYDPSRLYWPSRSIQNKREWIDILSRRSKWYVVMRIVVIHGSRSVHTSGLFGILGDAPIQIVDIRDQEKINALYDLAKLCERESPNAQPPQSFYRSSAPEMEGFLEDLFAASFDSRKMTFELRPTVMFRWCPLMCNHPGKVLDSMAWPPREDRY